MTQEALKLEREMKQLREVHAVQGRDGCWDIDDYMLGMFNGLELALCIMESRPPQYKERKSLAQQEQEYESVLIDGVAYTIPSKVAVEILGLHLDLLQLKQEQEPVAWEQLHEHIAGPFYTHPPQRTWVGLTDEDCDEFERWVEFKEEGSGRIPMGKLARYIEAKLKEKNT